MIDKKNDPDATAIVTGSNNKGFSRNLASGDNISSSKADVKQTSEKIAGKYKLLRKLQTSSSDIGLTSKCSWIAYKKDIDLKKGTSKSYYSGIIKCGNPWICPVCSSKIMRIRQQELQKAIHSHKQAGGEVLHLVLTFRHQKEDSLKFLLDTFKLSLQSFWRSGYVRRSLHKSAYIGRVTSTEITHGSSGWHPHQHILLFVGAGVDLDHLRSIFSKAWISSLDRSGLSGVRDVAVSLQDGSHTDKYVTKLSAEMTLGNVKQGRAGESMTFFDLLDLGYKDLCNEYVQAVKGRSSIMWSRGLKDHFSIVDLSDQDISNAELQEDKIYLSMTCYDYKNKLSIELRSLLQSLTDHDRIDLLKKACSRLEYIELKI